MNNLKKKFTLKYRKTRFANLFKDKDFIKFRNLIGFKKIENNQFNKIQNLCLDFILSSFDIKISKQSMQQSTNNKLNLILKNIKKLYSITSNGFIIPKSHSQLEYNLLLKSFYNLFNQSSLKNKIKYWQEPIGICIKYYDESNKEKKKRGRFYHQTSNAHIESWAGYSSWGINTLLPIFGNTKENYTEFFEPKNNFNDYEVNNAKKGNFEKIKNLNYKNNPINSIFKNHYHCGNIICWDNVFLHKTKIKNKKSFRIFIVNQFIPHLKKSEQSIEKISKFRKEGLLLHSSISDDDTFLKFSKKDNYKFKSTLGGKRAAYTYKLIK
jgi:hypothetical protein